MSLMPEVLAALNHPNIAQVYGLEQTPELTALVMALVEGEDLSMSNFFDYLRAMAPVKRQVSSSRPAARASTYVSRGLA